MFARLRIVAAVMMGALVAIGNALFIVLVGEQGLDSPPLWVILALLALGIGLHLMETAAGYRVVPLDPEVPEPDARSQAVNAFNASTMVRLALGESIAIVSLALAFVVEEGGFLVYATGAAISLLLMGYHGWPSERAVERVQEQLERDHARSHLREGLGLPPRPGGAIQEL